MAINDKETIVVSVSSNLDDKINFNRSGELNNKKLSKIFTYFERVHEYLKVTNEYKWLVESNRSYKMVIAVVNYGSKKYLDRTKKRLREGKIHIEILQVETILNEVKNYLKNTTIQNQLLRFLQIMNNKDYYNIKKV